MEKKFKYFSFEELERSNTANKYGIENKMNQEQREYATDLIVEVLDPARAILGEPITVSSGFRGKEVNSKVPGSSSTSQHCKGQAADLVCSNIEELFNIIKDNLTFDQLIFESLDSGNGKSYWVHVSYNRDNNRKSVMYFHNHKRIK